MITREENMMIGFTIVAIAGDARTAVFKAIESAKSGDFQAAEAHLTEANGFISEAHREQTSVLTAEAQEQTGEMSFTMIHGQDSLMTTMVLRDTARYLIDLYKEVQALKEK